MIQCARKSAFNIATARNLLYSGGLKCVYMKSICITVGFKFKVHI